MKQLLILAIFLSSNLTSQAQTLAGRKIINGSLFFNSISTQVDNNGSIVLSSSLLFGKIKEDETYWAFGGLFRANSINGNDYFEVGPTVERGKFVPLVDKLYLAPYMGANVSGIFQNNSGGIQFSAYASPLRFMYHLKEHFLITAGFGTANFTYRNESGLQLISLNASLTNNSGFGVFYTFQ